MATIFEILSIIEVNEDGAEAAAATASIMMMNAMVIVPEFTCDHPFMFITLF